MAGGASGGGGSVQLPIDLKNALSAEPSAQEAWDKLSPRDQQAHVDSLASAPDAIARERCLRELVDDLGVQVVRRSRR